MACLPCLLPFVGGAAAVGGAAGASAEEDPANKQSGKPWYRSRTGYLALALTGIAILAYWAWWRTQNTSQCRSCQGARF